MPIYEVKLPDGRIAELKADTEEQVMTALASLTGQAAPAEKPINEGDWSSLGQRVATAGNKLLDAGPTPPDMIEEARQEEARRQGMMYGKTRGSGETLLRSLTGDFALGAPNFMEALTSGWDSGLSFPERHEFIKAADQGREDKNQYAADAGLIGSIAAQMVGTAGIGPAKTMGGKMLQGLGVSAGLGGTNAALTSRGDPEQVAKATALSGALGLGGTALVEAASPLINKAGRAFSERSAKFSGPAADQAAARILAVAEKQGITPQAAQAEMARLGPEGMVADVLGTGGQRLMRTAGNTNDAAQQTIEEALMRRAAGAPERLANDIADAGGVKAGQTVEGLQDAIRAAEQPNVSALYKQAKDAGADLPNAPFRKLIESPLVQEAYRKAYKETQDRVIAFGEGENSALAVWDATKKNLDAIASQAVRSGDRATAALAGKLAKDVRTTVDLFTPAYSPARGASQSMLRKIGDVETGAAAAKMANAETIGALGKSANPKELAKGYAAQMVDMVLSKRGTPGLADALLGSPNQVQAMMKALGPGAAKVAERADIERQFARTQKGATGNSSTARQLADLGIIPGAAGVGYLGGYDPMQAGGIAALAVAGRRGVNKLLDARRSKIEAEVAKEVANLLVLQRMPKVPPRAIQGAEKRIAEALSKALKLGAPVAAGAMGAALVQ